MEKKINNILFFTDSEGNKMTFRVLFTHHSDTFNKDYAVFYNEDDENHIILFSYDENITLSSVNNNEEIEELNLVLAKFDEQQGR